MRQIKELFLCFLFIIYLIASIPIMAFTFLLTGSLKVLDGSRWESIGIWLITKEGECCDYYEEDEW